MPKERGAWLVFERRPTGVSSWTGFNPTRTRNTNQAKRESVADHWRVGRTRRDVEEKMFIACPCNERKVGWGQREVSHRHLHGNLLVWFVSDQLEIIQGERIDVFLFWVQAEHRKRPRLVLQLLHQRLHVVGVYMCIPQHMDEIARLEIADLRDHASQQGVAGNVERHTES
eukprot:scaffold363_cov331-Pavlova_lutheri.AAC.103